MNYIGIDLGGTKISGALFSEDGNILLQDEVLLEGRKGKAVGVRLITLIKGLCTKSQISFNQKISIAVCVPGIAYSKRGTVWAPNIPEWVEYPIVAEIKESFPEAIVTVESDRTCYILGEVLMGAASGCKDAIFIAVGTGIGAGIIIDGNILHGYSDIIGAIGWLALKPPYLEQYDACGCFESMASGEGIAACAKKLTGDSSISTPQVFRDYSNGVPYAIKVINQAIELWGMASANLVSIFNPELVIFGGGVFGPAIPLIGKIYDEACKWAQPISIRQARFIPTALPRMAGLYGAGAVAINAIKNK